MNLIIDNIDFWDGFQAMKYWSYPKTYDKQRQHQEIHDYIYSGAYMGSRKMDGIWLMIIKDNNNQLYCHTRTSNVNKTYDNKIEWIPHIAKALSDLPAGTVLLGELFFPNNEGSRKVTSVFNCLKEKCLERQEKNEKLSYYVFDVLAYKGKSLLNTPIEKRIEHYLYYELYDVLQDTYLQIADYKEGEELWLMLGEILESGGEGIVIQQKIAPYIPNKRTARVTIKVKKEISQTIDAFIDGAYKEPTREYSGKNPQEWSYWYNLKTGERYNTNKFDDYCAGAPIIPVTKPFFLNYAGAISFSVMKDGKPVHIGYISGVADEMKAGIVKEPEKWVGRVFEISAMEVEKTGISETGYSLRHGKLIGERTDKTPADCDFSQISE